VGNDMVAVMREIDGMIVTRSWLTDAGTADVLAEGLAERLGDPIESMCPLSATAGGWDRLAEAGAVIVGPEDDRPDEVIIETGRMCPFLVCHVDEPHAHPVCPACRAVRYGNAFCPACKDLRGSDLNPHRLLGEDGT